MILNLIKGISIDYIPRDIMQLHVTTSLSRLLSYRAWLFWLFNKSPKLNHFKHFGYFSLSPKIAPIVLKLWNLVKNKKVSEGCIFNLEIQISHCKTDMRDQLGHKSTDDKGWVRSRWLLGGWSDWSYRVRREQTGAEISNLIVWIDIQKGKGVVIWLVNVTKDKFWFRKMWFEWELQAHSLQNDEDILRSRKWRSKCLTNL